MWKLAKKTIEDRSTKISQQMRVKDCSKKNVEVGEEGSPSKIAPQKFPNRCASKIDRRRMWKLAKKSVEDRPTKLLLKDAHQRSIEEECESWRRSPSKVVPQKFLIRCASKIARRRMWKLAMKTIEGHSTKFSQQMRVKD
jgi:hypothetical protein